MVCILKLVDNEIKGWIIARDLNEAQRQVEAVGALCGDDSLRTLGEELSKTWHVSSTEKPGKFSLETPGYILLVS